MEYGITFEVCIWSGSHTNRSWAAPESSQACRVGAQGCLQGTQHTEKPVHSWQAGFVLQAWRLSELPREDIADWSPRAVLPAPRPPELPSPSTRGHPLVRLACQALASLPALQLCFIFGTSAFRPQVAKPEGRTARYATLLGPQVSARDTLQSSAVPSPWGGPGPLGFLSRSLQGLRGHSGE